MAGATEIESVRECIISLHVVFIWQKSKKKPQPRVSLIAIEIRAKIKQLAEHG